MCDSMKIAILGGTGSIGEGLALRWAVKHEVFVGSRKLEKAQASTDKYRKILEESGDTCTITGCVNPDAVDRADVVVLSVPYEHVSSTIETIKPYLRDQIIISIVVPMKKNGHFLYAPPESGCAAMEIQGLLPDGVKLVSAFHNVSAKKLADINNKLDMDVFICGDNEEANNVVSDLVKDIPGLNPMLAGPLEVSCMVESITPLLVNLAKFTKKKHLGIKSV